MDWQLDPTYPARGIDLVVPEPTPYPTGITSTDQPPIAFGGSFAAVVAAHPEYADRRFGGTSTQMYVEVGDDGDTITRIAAENGC